MLDGVVFGLPTSEQFTQEDGLRLLPTPTASDYMGFSKGSAERKKNGLARKSGAKIGSSLHFTPHLMEYYKMGTENRLNPCLLEVMMGFPMRWTELSV